MFHRHPTDLVERVDMALKKGFLGLRRIHAVNGLTRMGQPEHEHVTFGLHAVQNDPHFSEIDFRLGAGSVFLRDERLNPAPRLDIDLRPANPHVIPHR